MGELQRTMTRAEFAAWMDFYRVHPFDDHHRYHRPAAMIATAMAGGDVNERLDWLHPPEWQDDLEQADITTLKALGIAR